MKTSKNSFTIFYLYNFKPTENKLFTFVEIITSKIKLYEKTISTNGSNFY